MAFINSPAPLDPSGDRGFMSKQAILWTLIGAAFVWLAAGARAEEQAATIVLSQPLVFRSGEVAGQLSRERVDQLVDEDMRDGVTLTSASGGDQKTAWTCRDWHTLLSQDYFARTTYDMDVQSAFIVNCLTLRSLAGAKPVRQSFISDPRVGVQDLQLLSAKLLPGVSESDGEKIQELARQGETYATLAQRKEIKAQVASNRLTIYYNGMGQDIEEIARGADFDGDGIEDLLVVVRDYVLSGSFSSTNLVLLSRTTPTAAFSISQP
jgi:hypothetical protein